MNKGKIVFKITQKEYTLPYTLVLLKRLSLMKLLTKRAINRTLKTPFTMFAQESLKEKGLSARYLVMQGKDFLMMLSYAFYLMCTTFWGLFLGMAI